MSNTLPHLTGIEDLDKEEIISLLDRAQSYADKLEKGNWKSDLLKDKVILQLFFEASTRTRISFEMAAKRLGASVINWNAESSSMKKDESFLDTIQTLGAMKPNAVVIRHAEYNAPYFVSTQMSCPVINAGDSYHEHPSQALLDALTIRQAKGKIEGLTVTICGDVAHSRVANSNMMLLDKLGAKLRVIAPYELMPENFPVAKGEVKTFSSLEEGLPGSDIVMVLRIQKERMESSLIPDATQYFRSFGLTPDRLDLAGPEALVMHPGPMNRGVEISDDMADHPTRCLVKKQVANGIPTRMAILDRAFSKK